MLRYIKGIKTEKKLKALSAAVLLSGLIQLAGNGFLQFLAATGWFLRIFDITDMDYRIWNTGWLLLLAALISGPAFSLVIVSFMLRNLAAWRKDGLFMVKERLRLAGYFLLAEFMITALAIGYVWFMAGCL